MPVELSAESIRRAPKVLLHDHLDGGLRPETVLELADASGYRALPAGIDEADQLGEWFRAAADSGSLVRYLETFAHTVGVMATPDALHRVASECAQDLAADGVVYAEVRYAPELSIPHGMSMGAAVEAITAGLRAGERAAAEAGHRITVGLLLCAMRQNDLALPVAQLVIKHRDSGVVGFDIAGPEEGFSPTRQADAFEYLRRNNAHYTVHAGEAAGVTSIWEAVQLCGAQRLGHGVRIIDDARPLSGADEPDGPTLGRIGQFIRDRRIPLEIAVSSNLQTGIVAQLSDHPFESLRRLGFTVTINTDNRLMSATSMTRETLLLSEAFGYGWSHLRRFAVDALEAAFLPLPDRDRLVREVLDPGYAALAGLGADGTLPA